jgi:hypothetical protein
VYVGGGQATGGANHEECLQNFAELWEKAERFSLFLQRSGSHRELWEGLYRIARIPDWARETLHGEPRKLLVLAEDWCGDASNIVPFLARWADDTAGLELRILRRDQYPEVMNQYLTNGSRSIPIVIVLDQDYQELGHWGPRPHELQAWVMNNRDILPKAELYPLIRKWYARDRGETTLREIRGIGKTGNPT